MAGRENGRIQIQTVFLFQWIIVLITDNGIGIKGKSGRRFFLDKRSDKGEPFNWGLGLSYTYKVVNAHFGQCRVESQHEEYTSIYIMIPRIE